MTADLDALHQQLEAFNFWYESTLEKQGTDEKVQTPLYHYTSASALQGIIESQNVWLTSMLHLNDPSELKYGREIADEVLVECCDEKGDRLKRFREFFTRGFEGLTEQYGYFVASFSRDSDDLGQWRAYGDRARGVAIGFAPTLFHPVTPLEDLPPHEIAYVADVVYDRARAKELLSEPLERLTAIAAKFLVHENYEENQVRNFIVPLLTALSLPISWYSLLIKHEAYRHEQETRLIINAPRPFLREHIKFRPRGASIVPYLAVPFPIRESGNIYEIVLGPEADSRLEDAILTMLYVHGLDGHTKVRYSAIPYAL